MKYVLALFMLCPLAGKAQTDTIGSSIQFSGYAEVYYAYDFNQPEDHNRPSFLYSHDRHNEFNLNLGFVKVAYQNERVRANLAFAAGTYMNANYATEPGVLKNLYEAYAGIKISQKNNIWIDAGIFTSHIGFESAISKDCYTLTRSMSAENSPYYESGLKLTFISDDNKWLLSGLVLNGWQHIQRPDGNNTPSFGTQITFKPGDKITLNYSTFFGNDKPDDVKQMRIYHNVYGHFMLSDKFHFMAGFDIGFEQASPGSDQYHQWYSPVLMAKYFLDEKWSITGRGEFYSDPNEVIIITSTENGFQTSGFSFGIDYRILDNAVWMIEGRKLSSKDDIFLKEKETINSNICLTTSLAVSF